VSHPGAAYDAASVQFGPATRRTDILVVYASGFKVLRVADVDKHAESISKVSKTVVDDFAAYTTVGLGDHPKYISLSSDSLTVSVCFKDQQTNNVVHLYDTRSFKAPVMLLFPLCFVCCDFI